MNKLKIIIIVALLPNMAQAITWILPPAENVTYPFGTWDSGSSTFTLTSDLDEGDSIQIDMDYLTLDGAGYTVTSSGTSGYGVYLYGRSYVTITNINVEGFYNGIYVRGIYVSGSEPQYSTGNILSNNNVTLGHSSGIRLDYTINSLVTDNSISNCRTGINIYHSSDDPLIPGNTITRNTSSNNELREIYCQYAHNNAIYNNNFINDVATHAGDIYLEGEISGNVFNGNYWSDLTGPDVDEDGIVDIPYFFPGGQDEFPWVNEDGWLVREVEIDIKPGSYPNAINLGSNGVIPVAILSSDGVFDATTVDPETVTLAGAGVAVRGKGSKYLAHIDDVNNDGVLDLICQVETENLDPDSFQEGYAILSGSTYDGQGIVGSDEITIVPPSE